MKTHHKSLLTIAWFLIALFTCVLILCASGCESLRFAPNQAQKKIALQGHLTARTIEARGTSPHSPAAAQQVQATQAALTYIGLPKDPAITDYDTTLAGARTDAARRPDVNDVFTAVEGGLSIAEQLAALFGFGGVAVGGRSLVKWISLLRSKSKGMEQIVGGNELLVKWLKANGRFDELEAFKYFQQFSQKGRTPELVATARIPVKDQPLKTLPKIAPAGVLLERVAEPLQPESIES